MIVEGFHSKFRKFKEVSDITKLEINDFDQDLEYSLSWMIKHSNIVVANLKVTFN